MWSGMKTFVYRHKKKFLVGGIVISGAILASKYTQRKLIEWQEQEAKEFLMKTRKDQHFRSTERTCNQTICSLAETLRDTIAKITNTDDLLIKIRNGEGNKVLLWEDLKVQVFAQLSSLLYSGLMLVIVLRIQLNVIGGFMFKEKMDSQTYDIFSSTFQEHYLSLCHYFLNKGVKDICTLMEKHTRFVLENISLKQKLSLQDIEHIFWAIRSSLNNDPFDPLRNLPKYLLPPLFSNSIYKGVESEKMKLIVDETFDILDSEEVKSIADSCIKRAYSNVVDKIASTYYSVPSMNLNATYFGKSSSPEDNDFKNITKISIPLARIVPVIHGLYKEPPEENEEFTPWIHQFLIMDNINMLGANLYDAFSYSDL
uniref:Peroxisomal biogenesis factor 3 n=1 Tax=Triatoma dimidiata TaxID=72491 RepID=A0A0V0G8T8_TRIDM